MEKLEKLLKETKVNEAGSAGDISRAVASFLESEEDSLNGQQLVKSTAESVIAGISIALKRISDADQTKQLKKFQVYLGNV
jgi:hypothetical protein